MSKKKRRKVPVKARIKNVPTISYVCSNCGEKEEIPENVLEYFDDVNPEQLIFGAHEFKCEKCDTGIIKPENEIKPIIKGYGLFEGIEFNSGLGF